MVTQHKMPSKGLRRLYKAKFIFGKGVGAVERRNAL